MKKVFISVVIISFFMCFIPNTYAWAGPSDPTGSHYLISQYAFDYITRYMDMVKEFRLYNDEGFRELIKKGSYEPDIYEFISGTHYYVNGSDCNNKYKYHTNRHFMYQRSARTSFEEHYFSAILYYKEGIYDNASIELGRALHYIEDMACPVHAAGVSGRERHHDFEHYFDGFFDKYLKYEDYKYDFINNNISDICNWLVGISASDENISLINNPNPKSWDMLGLSSIPLSVYAVVGILERFIMDVSKDYKRNVAIGLDSYYIDVNTNGIYLMKDNKYLTTRFMFNKLKLKRISYNKRQMVYITYLDDRSVRITVFKSKFSKSITSNLKSDIFDGSNEFIFEVK